MYESVKDLPKEKSVIKEFPELAEMFWDMDKQLGAFEELTADQVLRYIILTYHFNSHLVQSRVDLMYRKKQAMLIAGVKTNEKGFFCEEAMKIIANRHTGAIELKMRFLRFENDIDWVELTTLTEMYYDYIRIQTDESQSTGSKTASDILKVKLGNRKESAGLKADIDALSAKVFRGDVDLYNYVGSATIKEEKRLRTSPEVYVEMKEKSKTNG